MQRRHGSFIKLWPWIVLLKGPVKVACRHDLVGGRVVSRGRSRERDSQAPRLVRSASESCLPSPNPWSMILHLIRPVHTSFSTSSHQFRIAAIQARRTSFFAKYPAPSNPIAAATIVSTWSVVSKILG